MSRDDFQELKEHLREFAEERDWNQFDVQGCANVVRGIDAGSGQFDNQKKWN